MTPGPNHVFLIIGSNLGDKKSNLEASVEMIKKQIGPVMRQSAIYETEPWGIKDQPVFYNQVVETVSELDALSVLEAITAIEKQMGRIRTVRYGSRLIDIDILFFNNEIIALPTLTIPHPRIAERNFVLAPLAELAGSRLHPVLNKTIGELWAACPDQLHVKKIQ